MIIHTNYPDLMYFINPEYTKVTDIPFYDNFFLIKDISYKERRALDFKKNFIVISSRHHDKFYDRIDIAEYITTKIKSRRKIKEEQLKHLTDEDFVHKMKLLYVANMWESEEEEVTIFNLFKEINGFGRFKIYYDLLAQGHHPNQILYSLLTFISRVYSENVFNEVSKYYARVIDQHSMLIKKNFMEALRGYNKLYNQIKADKNLDSSYLQDEICVLNFILVLGSANK